MEKQLRFGIIGAGLMGKRRAASIAAAGHIVSCVADAKEELAHTLAAQYSQNGCKVVSSDEVAKQDVDCVVVCTTTPHLVKYTTDAINHKKHVLVEKPLAMRLSDAKKIAALANEASKSGIVIKVGFNHRYLPTIVKAKELVGSGVIGDILFIKATYGQKGRIGYENEWRARKEFGGGELLDQGVHILDLCSQFVGVLDPSSVKGTVSRLFWGGDADDNAFFCVNSKDKFGSNNTTGPIHVPVHVHVSSSLWRNTFNFEIQGTLGRIEISGIRSHYGSPKLVLLTRNEQKSKEVGVYQFDEQVFTFPDEDMTWNAEIASFLSSVQHKSDVDGTAQDAHDVLSVIFSLYEKNGVHYE